jgi:hypothetical protein
MPWYGKAATGTYCAADFSYLAPKVQAVSDFYYFWLAPARLIDAPMAKKPGLYFAPPLFEMRIFAQRRRRACGKATESPDSDLLSKPVI